MECSLLRTKVTDILSWDAKSRDNSCAQSCACLRAGTDAALERLLYRSKEIQANTGKGISFHLLILNGFLLGPITQFEHLLPPDVSDLARETAPTIRDNRLFINT